MQKPYVDLENRKEIIRNYLRNNPRATFKEIKIKTHTKINKVYPGGIDEAYEDAEVPKPRTLKFKTKDEKRKIIINYIRKNPEAGGHIIIRDTKINFLTLFKNTKKMFDAAGIKYPRESYRKLIKRSANLKKDKIMALLRKNPSMSILKIGKLTNTHPYSLFKDAKEMYKKASIPFLSRGEKRRINKQNIVIEYIRNNPLSTQREINKMCKTKVQNLFGKGIFEAYEKSGVSFPFERLNLHGVVLKEIRDSAARFEEGIAERLSGYGSVNRLVRTKRGCADIILERNGRKVAVELKNYKVHEISISQIKQVNKYLEDIGSNLGFLICLQKPKKDTFLMGENKIVVLQESELYRIPEIMGM